MGIIGNDCSTPRPPILLADTGRYSGEHEGVVGCYSATEIAAAQAYLKQTDYTLLEGFLPISTAYGVAHDSGKTATKTSYRSLNEQAERLAQAMIDRLVSVTATKENL